MKQCLLLISILLLPFYLQAKGSFQPKSSLCFLENKGQVTDQHHHHRKDIQYKLDAGGMTVFIGNGQLHYQFYRPLKTDTAVFRQPIPDQRPAVNKPAPIDMYRMDVTLVGANPYATVVASEPAAFYERYHTTLLKDVTVYSYNKITYKNIYPHIDWVLYIKDNHLEYDFVVHPGGKVSDIQLHYGGATGMKQNSDGSITATTPMGSICEASPSSYQPQNRQKIASKFVLGHNTLRFTTAPYTGTLVIDPVLEWGTYYNCDKNNIIGTGTLIPTPIAHHDNGVYVAYETNNTANIVTTGAWQTTYGGGNYDIFIASFDSLGNRLWATYFGGDSSDNIKGMICNNGNMYIAGYTTSTDLGTAGTWQPNSNGGNDAIVAKFDSSGNLLWCTYYGGYSYDASSGIACDNNNNLYITGSTTSTNAIATNGAWQTSYAGGYTTDTRDDAFLAKFDTNGNLLWGTYYGGSNADIGNGVACDNMGHVDLLGWTNSANGIATVGAAQPTLNGGQDNFLAQFTTSGALLWGTYYGGNYNDFGVGMVCDNASNIYLTGYTYSTNNIATAGSYQSTFTGMEDGFLACFNGNGQQQWGTYFGSTLAAYTISLDDSEHIWIGGYSQAGLPVTAGAYQYDFLGTNDGFLSEFSNTGSLLRSTYYGTNLYIYNIINYHSDIYASGLAYTGNTNVITPGAFQTVDTSYISVVLAHFVPDSFYIPMPVTDTVFCGGDTLRLPYYCNFPFKAPNTFTALLSDTSGSFASAVPIGTLVDTLSDTITCVLPRNTMTGYHKILVTGNNLADTTTDTLTVFVTSTVPPIASVDSPLCPGDTLHLFADTIAQAIYRWTGPDNFSSSLQNPFIDSVAMVNTGSYFVTDSLNGCRSLPDTVSVSLNSATAITMYITVYPLTYVQGQNVTFTAHIAPSIPGLAYQWYRNGVPISGAADSVYASSSINKGDHIYLVVQSFDGNCISPHTITSNTIAVAVPNVTSSNDALSIYPNPNNGAFVLKGTVGATVHSLPVSVINALGQVVYTGNAVIHNGKVNQQLHLALAPGNYQVIVGDAVLRLEVVR